MQAIEPGASVPGYVVANWAVLRLPEVLRVNLGKSAEMISACSLMLPFIRTNMTEEYADNPKVFGRWQTRMLEPYEASHGVAQLLARPPAELNLGNFKLRPNGPAEAIRLTWSKVNINVSDDALSWSNDAPIACAGG
jgi:hypothetical protein